jgi:hypothetical protein
MGAVSRDRHGTYAGRRAEMEATGPGRPEKNNTRVLTRGQLPVYKDNGKTE